MSSVRFVPGRAMVLTLEGEKGVDRGDGDGIRGPDADFRTRGPIGDDIADGRPALGHHAGARNGLRVHGERLAEIAAAEVVGHLAHVPANRRDARAVRCIRAIEYDATAVRQRLEDVGGRVLIDPHHGAAAGLHAREGAIGRGRRVARWRCSAVAADGGEGEQARGQSRLRTQHHDRLVGKTYGGATGHHRAVADGRQLRAMSVPSRWASSGAAPRATRPSDHASLTLLARRVRAGPRMAHRTFVDPTGLEWQAWEVVRMTTERREEQRREEELPVDVNRRMLSDRRVGVRPGFEAGWLAFRSASGERRRLSPAPDGWDALPDEELSALLLGATLIATRRPDLFS